VINLNQWIHDFKDEYLQHHSGHIDIVAKGQNIHAKIDPSHLYQIINNLTDNGLRYSYQNTQKEILQIEIGTQQKDQRPYIDVIDFGVGVKSEDRDKIFEPFYTTEVTGSGLGLYLCRELSETNQANLSYIYDNDANNSIFRLTLSHPQRRIELQ
jgi:two-component system sensor histidine kinase PilS (NtrC family)